MKTLTAWLLLISICSGQALRSDWRSQYDLGMRPNSRTQSAMDANEDAIESLWNNSLKTRKGQITLGPEGYWIDTPVATRAIDGLKMIGSGGITLYESENHFAAGTAFGGYGSRLCAGATGMASLLDITSYGVRLQDITFLGNWRQAAGDAFTLANAPTTMILIRSNPGGNTLGTGKMVFDNLCFARGKNGITFAQADTENNADNCYFTRTEGQFLSEAIYRFKSPQSVVFSMGQTHSYYCAEVAYFERGGHADLGLIEVVEGPQAGGGTKVLHLGDPRENENWYRLTARLDNTCKYSGLKVIQMDSAGYGTIIDCTVSFGYDFVRYGLGRSVAEGGTDTIVTGTVNPTTEGSDGNFYRNTATNREFGPKAGGSWAGSGSGWVICDDIFDLYGACSVTLRGGPYYSKCLKLRSSGSRYPHVHFPSGTVFQSGITPDFCVNQNTSTGTWKVTWGDCVDVNGTPIPAGEMTN